MKRKVSEVVKWAGVEALRPMLRALGELHVDPANANRHDERSIAAVVGSLARFGQQKPVVVDAAGVCVAGSGTLEAAVRLGWTHLAAVTTGLTGSDRTAYAIADNRTNRLSAFDDEALAKLLAELKAEDAQLFAATGFTSDELTRLEADNRIEQPPIEDEIPPAPANPTSKPGDIYALGNHRLIVGDSTDPQTILRLLGSRKADILLTDPPYNVAYTGKTQDALTIENDRQNPAAFQTFLRAAFRSAAAVMRPGASFYIWHADSEGYAFRAAVHDVGLQLRQCLVWIKNTLVLGRQDYQWQHEPCLYGWKDGEAHHWYGDRKQITLQKSRIPWHINQNPDGSWTVVIEGQAYILTGDNIRVQQVLTTLLTFERPAASPDHPTTKPTALFESLIVNSSKPGEAVLDPFAGSGTTAIACEKSGRHAHLVELDPHYADIIVRRWENFTGKKATREAAP